MFYGSRQTSEEGHASQEGGMNAAETVEFPAVKSKVCILLHALCRKFNQFNPLTPKISSVILLSVHDIVPVMLVWRIWY